MANTSNIETERKFLVSDNSWKDSVTKTIDIAQGYLTRDKDRTVRVRITGDAAYITIKGKRVGASSPEFEYEIPKDDAHALLKLCLPGVIEKTRHHVPHEGHLWEVDIFHGENKGLVMAEIELKSEDETFALPVWAGAEVTADGRYTNAALSTTPYASWAKKPDAPKP